MRFPSSAERGYNICLEWMKRLYYYAMQRGERRREAEIYEEMTRLWSD